LAVEVVVNTGSLSPMWILAFSRFFTRMRGLARVLPSPASLRRLSVMAGLATKEVRPLRLRRST